VNVVLVASHGRCAFSLFIISETDIAFFDFVASAASKNFVFKLDLITVDLG